MCDIAASPTRTLPGWAGLVRRHLEFQKQVVAQEEPAAAPALPPVGGTDTPSSCFLYQLLGCCNSISKVLMTLYFPLPLVLCQK